MHAGARLLSNAFLQIHPGLFASAAPWLSGAAFKQVLSTYSNAAVACTYTRDVGSGQVKIDKDGRPRLHYVLGKADQENIWKVCSPCMPTFKLPPRRHVPAGHMGSTLCICACT